MTSKQLFNASMSSPCTLLAARIDRVRHFLGDGFSDLSSDIWSYFPPIIPNCYQLDWRIESPPNFVAFRSDCFTRKKAFGVYNKNNGRMVHRIDFDTNGDISGEPDFLFKLESAYDSAFVYDDHLYYVLKAERNCLRKRPLRKKATVSGVAYTSWPIEQIQTSAGLLFLVEEKTHNLFRVDAEDLELVLVRCLEYDRTDLTESDENYMSSLVDAVAEGNKLTRILYYTGGRETCLRLWNDKLGEKEVLLGIKAGEYRFLPGTELALCPSFLGVWYKSSHLWIYNMDEKILIELDCQLPEVWRSWYAAAVPDRRWKVSLLVSTMSEKLEQRYSVIQINLLCDPKVNLEPVEGIEVV